MKVRASVKRSPSAQIVRRKRILYVINKKRILDLKLKKTRIGM
jgi:ribosomal protein L36